MSQPIPPEFREICQERLPAKPWSEPALNRLPGMVPIGQDDWILQDEAFAAQMAFRDYLAEAARGTVLARTSDSAPAIEETLQALIAALQTRPGYRVGATHITRPDGVTVALADPLQALGRLVQEDICILLPGQGGEHCLVAAALLFPASWSLEEKLGHPLTRIHRPVAPYTEDIARRVQRLFDLLRPARPLMRMNALTYADPCLFQPRRENARRNKQAPPTHIRCERQCLTRLPETGAVVFSIHTYVLRLVALVPQDWEDLGLSNPPA